MVVFFHVDKQLNQDNMSMLPFLLAFYFLFLCVFVYVYVLIGENYKKHTSST